MAKSKCITLRVKPELHQQLADTAKDLGLNLNGLLNLLIHRSLGQAVVEACIYKAYMQERMGGTLIPLFLAWRKANPKRKPKDFQEEFRKHILGEPSDIDTLPPAEG